MHDQLMNWKIRRDLVGTSYTVVNFHLRVLGDSVGLTPMPLANFIDATSGITALTYKTLF
jgi:hypothetical protein